CERELALRLCDDGSRIGDALLELALEVLQHVVGLFGQDRGKDSAVSHETTVPRVSGALQHRQAGETCRANWLHERLPGTRGPPVGTMCASVTSFRGGGRGGAF